jgi:hypothetical protein
VLFACLVCATHWLISNLAPGTTTVDPRSVGLSAAFSNVFKNRSSKEGAGSNPALGANLNCDAPVERDFSRCRPSLHRAE